MRKALSPYIATRTMDYGTGRWAPVIEELSGRGGYVIHKARPELHQWDEFTARDVAKAHLSQFIAGEITLAEFEGKQS